MNHSDFVKHGHPHKLPKDACALDQIKFKDTDKRYCEDCAKIGDGWVHLRECMICGHVGCCDSSQNKHATAHFETHGHALTRSIEPTENWAYCFSNEQQIDVPGIFPLKWTKEDKLLNPNNQPRESVLV
jgi:hypothetical protein